jgi:phosphate transport system permease protein
MAKQKQSQHNSESGNEPTSVPSAAPDVGSTTQAGDQLQRRVTPNSSSAARPAFAGRVAVSAGRKVFERVVESGMFLAAASSVVLTVGIVAMLLWESFGFFRSVSIVEFLTSRRWAPTFEPAGYGILPLLLGTLLTSAVGLVVAGIVGTTLAVWLSEYASYRVRETLKPILELLAAVPTVVYGYFALLFVTPLLQKLMPNLPGSTALSAGLVIGIMIVPYIASLTEDALRAVPGSLREASFAMGATRFHTAWRVVLPAAFSGVTSAFVLAVSRALGETMIVAIAAGMEARMTINPLEPAQTITAFIVQITGGDLPQGSIPYKAIFAAGLMLLMLTLVFNILGHWLRKRFREAY